MASRLTEVIIDCEDLDRQVGFWSDALGYGRASSGDGWVALRPPGSEPTDELLRAGAPVPAVTLVAVPEPKSVKNRLHLDLTPVDRAQAEEVARLEALGARRADVGQGTTHWIVMADPEGNEFCVMPEVAPRG
jgi:catechol 2,3-dioxygenase-like lactoylglutathione lyase family enzyme